MSVIIRLQNLPWSANAADIRNYFHGLNIPEGGVHIVGGEEGDAFIAFGTDEDARQAMLRDRGKLKEVQIRLLLSSQAEMARIIDLARKQTVTLHDIIQKQAVAPSHVPSMVPHPMQVPVTHTQTQKQVPTVHQLEANNEDSRGKSADDGDKKDRRDRRSSSRDRGRSRGNDRDRDRNDRDRSRGHYSGRRRRDRSRSRDRYRRRSKSRSRERTRWGSRERTFKPKAPEKNEAVQQPNSNGEDGSLNWEVVPPQQPQPIQVPQTHSGKVTLLPDPPNLSMLAEPPALPPAILAQMQATNGKQMSPQHNPSLYMPPVNMPPATMQHPMAPVDADRRNMPSTMPSAMPSTMPATIPSGMPSAFPPQAMMPTPFMPNPMMRGDTWPMPMMDMSQMPRPDMAPFGGYPMMPMSWPNMAAPTHPQMPQAEDNENCIEIRSLPLNASYVDVKRLFDGLTIPPDGIKMINDDHGNRTGIAYVRFSQHGHKLSALNQNGKKVRSNIVEVLHLSESIYSKAIDNYRPEKDMVVNSVDMDIENGEQQNEESKKRFDPRTASRDSGRSRSSRDIGGRDRDRDRDRDPRGDRDSRNMSSKKDPASSRRMGGPQASSSTCVVLQNLPPQVSKSDVFDFFSSVGLSPNFIHLVMEMGEPIGKAICQFSTPEGAEKALTKDKTTMGRYTVSVNLISSEEVEGIRRNSNERWEGFLPLDPMEMRGGLYQGRMQEGGMQQMYGGGMDGSGDRSMGGGRGSFHNWNNNHERFNKPSMGDRNYMGNDQNDSMGSYYGRGGSGRGRGHPPFRGRGGGPLPRPTSPFIDGPNVNNFGKPGCVVAMENIHFRADVDEIINFFDGFKVEREDIIRRFDDGGRPTGDARVSLKSPPEALRAVRTLNYHTIRGRTVKLSIL